MSLDVARLSNIFGVQITSLYYDQTIGTDWNFWFDPSIKYQNQTLESFLKQEALKNSIVTTSVNVVQEEFDLVVTYQIASESEQQSITVRN